MGRDGLMWGFFFFVFWKNAVDLVYVEKINLWKNFQIKILGEFKLKIIK